MAITRTRPGRETQRGLSPAKSARRKRPRAHLEKDRVRSILVRDLDQKTVQRLKERARLGGRWLQQEVKEILERAAGTLTMSEADGCPRGGNADSAGGRSPTACD